jgi:hypothetical protein
MPNPEHDPSASTARFRAFANGRSGSDTAPWSMRAPSNRVTILAGAVVAVAVVLFIIALLVLG